MGFSEVRLLLGKLSLKLRIEGLYFPLLRLQALLVCRESPTHKVERSRQVTNFSRSTQVHGTTEVTFSHRERCIPNP